MLYDKSIKLISAKEKRCPICRKFFDSDCKIFYSFTEWNESEIYINDQSKIDLAKELKKTKDELESQKKNFEEKKRKYKERLQKLDEHYKKVNKEKDLIKKKYDHNEQEFCIQLKENDKCKAIIEETTKENKRLSEENEALKSTGIDDLRKAKELLEKELNAVKEELSNHKDELNKMQNFNNELRKENEELNEKLIQQFDNTINKDNFDELKIKFDQTENMAKNLKFDNKSLAQEIDKIKYINDSKIQKLNQQILNLNTEKFKLKNRNSELSLRLKKTIRKFEEYEYLNNESSMRIEKLLKENDDYKRKLNIKETNVNKPQEEMRLPILKNNMHKERVNPKYCKVRNRPTLRSIGNNSSNKERSGSTETPCSKNNNDISTNIQNMNKYNRKINAKDNKKLNRSVLGSKKSIDYQENLNPNPLINPRKDMKKE